MKRLFIFVVIAFIFQGSVWSKSAPSFHTREQIAKARELCRTEPWAAKIAENAKKNAKPWIEMSDQELWEFVLDAEVPRALNVRFEFGCPIHGEEVFRKGGHYPWILSSDHPFKVKCPVGGEFYPTNDFESYLKKGRKEKLNTREKYVDDGFGWIDENGNRYWFVGHYIFWHRWRKEILGGAIPSLGSAFELTGDPVYAHKLGVLLGRICEVYPKMDYATQAYHNGKWPAAIDGRILDYIWENSTIYKLSLAYDQIYDAIEKDESLGNFLREKGIQDFKKEYEQKVLHFMARDIMAGKIRGNMHYQPTIAHLARIIDNQDPGYGPTTKQMTDWLLHGGGEVELILYNGFDRNGAGGESAPGYCTIWNRCFCNLAEDLIRLDVDITENPKWKQIVRFPYNLTLAGKHIPRVGDSGRNIRTGSKIIDDTILKFGYNHFRDPQCAQLLLGRKVFGNSLWGETLDKKEVQKVAKSAPDRTRLCSRNLGGYGMGIFEAGNESARRAATLYYGSPGAWHTHLDRLTIDYWAHGRTFLPEMGYPSHWNDKGERFIRGMASHYLVMIDEKSCKNRKSGYLDFFASGEKVRVMRAEAKSIYKRIAKQYHRTLAMIDVGDESFLVDLFCVEGGDVHDYLFHGLPSAQFSTQGLSLSSSQEKGTLLGEDIPWGGDRSGNQSGYDFLKNVRRYKAQDCWHVKWKDEEDCRLGFWMPSFSEVILCDGEPPFHPGYPETMEFFVVRSKSSQTLFPAVISPSKGADLVQDAGFSRSENAIHYEVKTINDLWKIDMENSGKVSVKGASDDGSHYYFHANIREYNLGNKKAVLEDQRRYSIQSVDYKTNTVQVERDIIKPELLIDEVAVISGGGYSASYTVQRATKRSLCFKGPAITGICRVDSIKDKTLVTKSRITGYGSQLGAKELKGMVLVPEDYKKGVSIVSYKTEDGITSFTLKNTLEFLDTDGDKRVMVYFSDFTQDYEIWFTPWVETTISPEGEIQTRSNTILSIKQE